MNTAVPSTPLRYPGPRSREMIAEMQRYVVYHPWPFAVDLEGCEGMTLATVDGQLAGCCALRPMDAADYPNAAEMKRLYVRPAFRGLGLGRQLAEAVLDAARPAGYGCVLLDTLNDMEAARALYEDLGFEEIPPYYHNPIAGAHYLKADLERTTGW